MMKLDWVLRVALLAVAISGCQGGGDDDAGGDEDGGGAGDGGGDGGNVPGVAHVVQGATPPPAFLLTSPAASLAADGNWNVSPDKVEVTITRVNFEAATPEEGTGADFVDCVVTYDRSAASLSPLLDCPFSVAPGTYASMNLFVDPTVQILISDAANGIFTDPASDTGLSSSEPVAGADFVPVTATAGAGFQVYFTSPLVVEPGDSLSLSFVVDAVHTTEVIVSGSGTTLEFGTYFPARVFPTIGEPGVPQYYNSTGSAESYNGTTTLAHMIRIYFGPGVDAQPVRLSLDQLAGSINSCQAGGFGYVFPADPDMSPPSSSGDRAGGWLGVDPDGTICGAVGTTSTFETYHSYFRMPYVANVGDSTVFSCEMTSDPTPPTSGSTYASGCPAIVSELGSASLTLVAD